MHESLYNVHIPCICMYFLWAKSHKGIFLMHWIIFSLPFLATTVNYIWLLPDFQTRLLILFFLVTPILFFFLKRYVSISCMSADKWTFLSFCQFLNWMKNSVICNIEHYSDHFAFYSILELIQSESRYCKDLLILKEFVLIMKSHILLFSFHG